MKTETKITDLRATRATRATLAALAPVSPESGPPAASALNSTKGIRAVSEWLEARAREPQSGPVSIGPLKIHGNPRALSKAAALVKRNNNLHAKAGRCAAVVERDPDYWNREAVRLYGSEVAGVAALKRQLVQAPDMDPAAVKRSERALAVLERGHSLTRCGTRSRHHWNGRDLVVLTEDCEPYFLVQAPESVETLAGALGRAGDFNRSRRTLELSQEDFDTLTERGFILKP